MNHRTDLAIELALEPKDTVLRGHQTVRKKMDGTVVWQTTISSPEGERQFGKPAGDYFTVEVVPFSRSVTHSAGQAEVIARILRKLLPDQDGLVLVAGLGNFGITPDALGPKIIDGVLATRHLAGEWKETAKKDRLRPVAAIAPGVLGQTGIETSEIITCLCEKIKPSCTIILDALAARSLSRLGSTVQIANVGLVPGSGAMNRRAEISRRTLGVPVISMGVPTVTDGITVGSDLLTVKGIEDPQLARALFCPSGQGMLVTPKEIDLIIDRAARMLSMAINRALHPRLSPEEIWEMTA